MGPVPRDEPGYTQIDVAQRVAGFHAALVSNCHTGNWTRPRLGRGLGCFYDHEGRWSPDSIGLPWVPKKIDIDDPEEISEIVKETALFLGASLVGITKLNRDWVYKTGWKRYEHKEVDLDTMLPPSLKYAIVMAIETDYDYVKYAPTAKGSAAAGLGYSKMAFLAPSLAKFIASLGYKAVACGNDTALSIPLAIDAGLGELGRNGLLITPEFGPRVRLCKVITDLPLKTTKPIDFGVTRFCEKCKKCAEYCPSQAISYDERTPNVRTESTSPGVLKWPIDGEKCLRFWYRNGAKTKNGMYHIDCYQCVNVCPFNKKSNVKFGVMKWLVRNLPIFNKQIIYSDKKFNKPIFMTGIYAKGSGLYE